MYEVQVQHNCHVLKFGAELFMLLKGWRQHLEDGFLKWKKTSVPGLFGDRED